MDALAKAEEKANELFNKFMGIKMSTSNSRQIERAAQCALIFVEEMIENDSANSNYWHSVKHYVKWKL